jgi:hypothetical protein
MKVKALWAAVQENPVLMRKFNGYMTVFWMVMIPVSILTGWVTSVEYVSALSIYALITGHLSSWQAARVEVIQQKEAEKRDDDAPERIEEKVDKLHEKV